MRILLSLTVDGFIKKANSTEIVFPFHLPFWYIAEKIFISILCKMSHFYQNLLMTKQSSAFYSFTQGIQYKYIGKDDKWHWVAKTNIQRAGSDRPYKHSMNTKRVRNN